MWSLGAVITYIANDKKHLFKNGKDVLQWKGKKSPMGRKFKYQELHNLVLSLLSTDKHKRPTAREVKQDGYDNEHRIEEPKN